MHCFVNCFLQATKHVSHINSSAVNIITVSMLHGGVMEMKIVQMDQMKKDVVSY